MPIKTAGYAAPGPSAPLEPFQFEHRDVGEQDVHIKVHYAGICHSDIHNARDEWWAGSYPMVPGHEIAGVVVQVGDKVTKHGVGDRVGVGCLVDSCRVCGCCTKDLEQHCLGGAVWTYNSKNKDGSTTYGGYANDIVVTEDFVFKIPGNLDFKDTAPLLCAGITTYNPLKRWGMKEGGKKVGVIGFGGLGHMGVKLAIAMGNEVTVISRTENKKAAAEGFGARFINMKDEAQVAKHALYFDFILDTASAKKDMVPYMNMLGICGTLAFVGAPAVAEGASELPQIQMLFKSNSIGASLIGGRDLTQEMLYFCGEKDVVSTCEHIKMPYVNEAWERTVKSDVKFRFVIDVLDSDMTVE